MDAEPRDALSEPAMAITDVAVDRELQALVSVDPSRQFLARVRGRIADEPAPVTSPFSWRFAGVLAAAAAAVVVVMLVRWSGDEPVSRPAVPQLAATALPNASTTIAAPERSAIERTNVPADSPAPARAGVSVAAAPAPEVLLDAREAAALRALIAGVRAGRVDLAPVLSASAPSPMDLPPLTAIAIQPIAIDPLEEGVRQ
jgi:hypothetical protein